VFSSFGSGDQFAADEKIKNLKVDLKEDHLSPGNNAVGSHTNHF
jgi:hypothetical protein